MLLPLQWIFRAIIPVCSAVFVLLCSGAAPALVAGSWHLPNATAIKNVTLLPNGRQAIAGYTHPHNPGDTVALFDIQTGEILFFLDREHHLVVTPDGSKAVGINYAPRDSMTVYDLETGARHRIYHGIQENPFPRIGATPTATAWPSCSNTAGF